MVKKVVVIGGGPGGYVAAIRAAQLGASVTLVEKEHLGGTCLNVGCLPTKALLHTAEVYTSCKNSAFLGLVTQPQIDYPAAQKYKDMVVRQMVGGIRSLLKANKVAVIHGNAKYKTLTELLVETGNGTEVVPFDASIIATGSSPIMPPIPGIALPCCIDSTAVLSLAELPKSMVIMGGGVIGVEMAVLFASLGTDVTIVEMMPFILGTLDRELTGMLAQKLESMGVKILCGTKVTRVVGIGEKAELQVEKDGIVDTLQAEKVLVSVGRRPNTQNLGLETIGVKLNCGRILVNEQMQTSLPHIYAIGDCANGTLAHVASAQGEVAAEHIMGGDVAYDGKTVPSCVYSNPELSSVGLSESQAREQGLNITVGKFPLFANGKSVIINGGEGTIKVVADKVSHRILGVQILGPHATDLITAGALALQMNATLDDVAATVHAHPTVGEALREAALAALQRPIHVTL